VKGRRRSNGNHSSQKNNSIQDSLGKEENGYPVPDPNKTMINVTKKPTKKPSKRESWKNSLRNSWKRH
jgi:hypothetical protein